MLTGRLETSPTKTPSINRPSAPIATMSSGTRTDRLRVRSTVMVLPHCAAAVCSESETVTLLMSALTDSAVASNTGAG